MTNLNSTILNNLPIQVIPYAEQQKINQEIETRLSVCDQLEQTIEDSLKKAEALRQSILKKAFEGELTKAWREENPELISGENSAESLLARIRAEKARLAGEGKKAAIRKGRKK
jgi:type I restriction enzyme, S subunit